MRVIALLVLTFSAQALPLWFEPNQGQTHASVQFLSRDVYLSSNKAAIRVGDVKPIVLRLIGAQAVRAEGLDPLPGITSYFLGNDPTKWRSGVPHFARVRFRDVYPGIDLIYYHTSDGRLEYDFIVNLGADPNAIQLTYNYPIRIDSKGDLVIAAIRQRPAKILQNGREIKCNYRTDKSNRVQLVLAKYDHSQPLTIDPVLDYSTYFGGPAFETGVGIQVDSKGFIYLGLFERAPADPTLNPFQQTSGVSYAAFALKMTPDGKGVVWYAYVGGTGDTFTEAMTIDSVGNVYLTGQTRCLDFPVKNAAQSTYGGGFNDSYVAKISSDGRSIAYATYLGGFSDDDGSAIVVDTTGAAYVGGYTNSLDFPVKNALQASKSSGADGFVTKLSPDGKSFVFSTFLGGSALDNVHGLALDSTGAIYLTGYTASDDFPTRNALQPIRGGHVGSASGYVTKLTPSANSIVYSTFLGGTAGSGGWTIAVDSTGSAFVCGITGGGLNVKNAFQATYGGGQADIFLAGINPTGSDFIFSTYLGGSDLDFQNANVLALDSMGNIYVIGFTYSSDFPLKNSLQPFVGATTGYKTDAFLAKFAPTGGLIYSTLIGGHGDDRGGGITVDHNGEVYLTGLTTSEDFPLKNPFQKTYAGGNGDAFIVKLGPDSLPSSPFTAVPGTIQFRYVIGAAAPAEQKLSIAGGSSFAVTTTGGSWLSASPSSGISPGTLTVFTSPLNLTPAIYTGTVRVSAADGSSVPLDISVTLNVLAPAPVIMAISPNVVPVNSDGTTFTITGSGFTSSSAVSFDGSTTLPTSFIDGNSLQFSLSKDVFTIAGSLSIVVLTPQTAASNAVNITIGTPAPSLQAVTNAANFTTGAVAPGEIVSIFGTNLDQHVTFDAVPASPIYFSPTQVNVTVPYSISGSTTRLQMGASFVQLQVARSAPGIFAAVPSDGGIMTLYATGCGALTNDDLPRCALPVSVTVNDQPATVLYAGIAPGLVQGTNQINVQLPDAITTGQITIVLTAGDISSKPFVWAQP